MFNKEAYDRYHSLLKNKSDGEYGLYQKEQAKINVLERYRHIPGINDEINKLCKSRDERLAECAKYDRKIRDLETLKQIFAGDE